MDTLQQYVPLVEQALQKMGVDTTVARKPDLSKLWALTRGSAQILVSLSTVENYRGKRDIFSVLCPIAEAPTVNREQLFELMLRENHAFISEKFSIYNNVIYIWSGREVEGLGVEEVISLIDNLSWTADAFDEKVRQFIAPTRR